MVYVNNKKLFAFTESSMAHLSAHVYAKWKGEPTNVKNILVTLRTSGGGCYVVQS